MRVLARQICTFQIKINTKAKIVNAQTNIIVKRKVISNCAENIQNKKENIAKN